MPKKNKHMSNREYIRGYIDGIHQAQMLISDLGIKIATIQVANFKLFRKTKKR